MGDSFKAWVAVRGGFFRRREAIDAGFRDTQLRAGVHAGVLVKLRHGYYAFAEHIEDLDDAGRYRLLCRAVHHRLGDGYALVGSSGCAMHGVEMFGANFSVVHVAHLGGSPGRREAGVHFHERTFDPEKDVVEVDGVLVTTPAESLWAAACMFSTEGALVAMNSALHRAIVDPDSVNSLAPKFNRWAGSRTARLAWAMADERIESVGESRTFFLCWEFHLPRPEPQYRVRNGAGTVIARSDFAWLKQRHLAEFDGKVKYLRFVRPDESPSQVVMREKRREDLVRDELFGMSRVIWSDLEGTNRRHTAASLERGIERSSKLYTRNRTVIVG